MEIASEDAESLISHVTTWAQLYVERCCELAHYRTLLRSIRQYYT